MRRRGRGAGAAAPAAPAAAPAAAAAAPAAGAAASAAGAAGGRIKVSCRSMLNTSNYLINN
jgi:hypothetical protein